METYTVTAEAPTPPPEKVLGGNAIAFLKEKITQSNIETINSDDWSNLWQ